MKRLIHGIVVGYAVGVLSSCVLETGMELPGDSYWTQVDSDIYYAEPGGRIGVGIAAPAAALHVDGDIELGLLSSPARLRGFEGDEDDALLLAGLNIDGDGAADAQIWSEWRSHGDEASFAIRYRAPTDTGTASHSFFVDGPSANVGIGTDEPDASMDIGNGSRESVDGVNDILVADSAEVDGQLYVDGPGTSIFKGAVQVAGDKDNAACNNDTQGTIVYDHGCGGACAHFWGCVWTGSIYDWRPLWSVLP